MSEFEGHTPGPWFPGHFVDDTHTCDCKYILGPVHCGSIATINVNNGMLIGEGGNGSPPLEEAKANARLIAAAPDLLAENIRLRAALSQIDALTPNFADRGAYSEDALWVALIRISGQVDSALAPKD